MKTTWQRLNITELDSRTQRWRGNLFLFILSVLLVLGLAFPTAGFAACTDNDGDGYGYPGSADCTYSEEDCDDNNSAINPGATELCNGVDDDCDGLVDEGFGTESPNKIGSYPYECGDADEDGIPIDNDVDGDANLADSDCEKCNLYDPPGCTPGVDDPCCVTQSFYICNGGTLECFVPETGLNEPEAEIAYTDECHDGDDNDCDSLIDGADPGCAASQGEICNGLDDDYDGEVDEGFPGLGDPCTVGTGACERTGNYICNETNDGTICSATAGSPGLENTPGTGNCLDEIDNDCDGLVDLADSDCHADEKCDGIDNDGDGLTDEDFLPSALGEYGLGETCTVGAGACVASGVMICSPDKTTTVCSAVPELASVEGPTGATCSDGIDNDCDGHTDNLDPDCGSAGLMAYCALPYIHGKPGDDCTGWHEIQFGHQFGPDATVTAELVALDMEGNVLDSTPVEYGDTAHLASRIYDGDYKFSTKTNKRGTRHQVFAPVPLLRVTVEDGLNRAQAYCSNIPYIEVVEPSGTVVTESEGDVTRVLTAIPLVDPSTLRVKVDGVYILQELGINPEDCTSSSPCGGTITTGPLAGVEVSDLVVGVSPVEDPGANSLRMNLSNLGCGGHVIVVEADEPLPGSFPTYPTEDCHADDLRDKGTSSGLAVKIDEPAEGDQTFDNPVPIIGKACSGQQIAGVRINGLSLDVEGNVDFTPGDGEDSGDLYEYPIDTALPQTDLAAELTTGVAQVGTFDPGSNRLIAEVTDDLGNRSFKTLFFAVGDVAKPGVGPLAKTAVDEILETVKSMVRSEIQDALESTTVEIENAFVVGLKPEALQKVFDALSEQAAPVFKDEVRANLLAVAPVKKKVSGGCSCKPNVTIRITDVEIDPDQMSCTSTFVTDRINILVHLPDVKIYASAYGKCKTTGLFGECWAETIVDVQSTTTVTGIEFGFSVTEGQLRGDASPEEPTFEITAEADVSTTGGSEVNCVAAVCNWALETLTTILTFGQADLDLSPQIDVSKEIKFKETIHASKPDPFDLKEIKVDEEEVESFGQVLRGDLDDVQITPNGLRATLKGTFSTLSEDPEVEDTPGATLTPAGPPVIHPSEAGEVYLALADDTFNQLFASMTASGKLKTSCEETELTFSDLLPADCEALNVADKPFITAVLQGTCHGWKGDDCSDIYIDEYPLIAEGACNNAKSKLQSLNISSATPLLLCVKQDNPPNFLIMDDSWTDPVETVLRLNDLSVAVLLDRGSAGFDGTQLSSIPQCFDPNAQTNTTGDCLAFAMCLDIDLLTEMSFEECMDGKPGLAISFNNILVTDRVAGMVCGGAPPADDDLLAQTAADSDPVNIDLTGNVEDFTPPICAEGLDIGGFVEGLDVSSVKVIAIDAAGGQESPFQDYLGITGNVEK